MWPSGESSVERLKSGSDWVSGRDAAQCVSSFLKSMCLRPGTTLSHPRFTFLVPRKILDTWGEIVVIFQPYYKALEI